LLLKFVGGAIWTRIVEKHGFLVVNSSTVTKNKCNANGCGINVLSASLEDIIISHTEISNNTVTNSSSASGSGGGVYIGNFSS
jgi:hypothetical protein